MILISSAVLQSESQVTFTLLLSFDVLSSVVVTLALKVLSPLMVVLAVAVYTPSLPTGTIMLTSPPSSLLSDTSLILFVEHGLLKLSCKVIVKFASSPTKRVLSVVLSVILISSAVLQIESHVTFTGLLSFDILLLSVTVAMKLLVPLLSALAFAMYVPLFSTRGLLLISTRSPPDSLLNVTAPILFDSHVLLNSSLSVTVKFAYLPASIFPINPVKVISISSTPPQAGVKLTRISPSGLFLPFKDGIYVFGPFLVSFTVMI